MVLGQVQLIEAKRLFAHAFAEGGTLEYVDGTLRIYPAPLGARDLAALSGWRCVKLIYATDRFERRGCEHGRRIDGRPFAHVFTRRPEILWNAAGRYAVLPGVAMQTNQLGEPTYIEG